MTRSRRPSSSRSDDAARGRQDPESTTQLLLQAASEEFIQRGYEAARINEIARRVGVTAGAVYGRWHHKADVLAAALEYTFERILPDRVIKHSQSDGLHPPDLLALLSASLLPDAGLRDVMVHAFGSARNNEEIAACLKEYINRESEQISGLIEEGKQAGFCDPDLSTAAMSLMCQAVGIGVHLVISAGLDEDRVPSADDWNELNTRLIEKGAPPSS